MATFFGWNDDQTNYLEGYNGYWIRNSTGYIFTCPGSGTQVVQEISALTAVSSGTGQFRMAIYNSSNSKVCEGTGLVSITNTTRAWNGHMSPSAITPNPANLTGGATYKIALYDHTSVLRIYYTSVASTITYGANDYSAGFPSTLAEGTSSAERVCIRASVDPAAAGLLYPQLERLHRGMMRGMLH